MSTVLFYVIQLRARGNSVVVPGYMIATAVWVVRVLYRKAMAIVARGPCHLRARSGSGDNSTYSDSRYCALIEAAFSLSEAGPSRTAARPLSPAAHGMSGHDEPRCTCPVCGFARAPGPGGLPPPPLRRAARRLRVKLPAGPFPLAVACRWHVGRVLLLLLRVPICDLGWFH